MRLGRREFLGASSAIFGLHLLGCDEPGPTVVLTPPSPVTDTSPTPAAPQPEWVNQGLAQMKSTGKPGVVLRIPADLAKRRALGSAIMNLVSRGDGVLLAETIFICATASTFAPKSPHAAVLIDCEGRVIDGTSPDWSTGSAEADLRQLVHGKDNARLRQRAKAAYDASDATLRRAMDGGELRPTWENAARILPWLILESIEGKSESRGTATYILGRHVATIAVDARLPFGIVGKHAGGCGGSVDDEAPPEEQGRLFACGRGAMNAEARVFAHFLAAKE